MQCPACALEIPSGESRCPTCGAEFVTSAPTEPMPPASSFSVPNLPPGSSFAGRYTLIEKAGQGGMGVVYKAIDNSLEQVVALKLLRQDLAGNPAFVERFKQEVRLTRQIAHPNVCRVHDLGDFEGQLFLSMEWIEGETLRRLLHQAVRLEPRRALEIAAKIHEALSVAHGRGIVHRDLKPENVMIDHHGSVFVMDFGVALGPGEGQKEGRSIGTPTYMSPEQRRGEPVDSRTDLYALGLILREMLAGPDDALEKPLPVPEPSRQPVEMLLQSMLAEEPAEREVSRESLDRAIQGLEESPEPPRRWWWEKILWPKSRRARLLLAAGAVVLTAVVYFAFQAIQPPTPGSAAPHVSSGAHVSPPGLFFFKQGLQNLRNEGETSVTLNQAITMFNRAVEKDPGSAVAWACLGEAYWIRYERGREAPVRDEAREAVEKAERLDPDLPEVHNAKGRGFTAVGNYAAAVAELKKAVRKDPDFDAAWANLGMAYREIPDGYQSGLKAVYRAIRLKPRNFRYRVDLGLLYYDLGQNSQAEKAYRKALDLNPDSVTAWDNLGAVLLVTNRPNEAIHAFQESLKRLKHAWAYSNLGTAYYYLGDYQTAATHYREAVKLEPWRADYWGNLGDALRMLGRNEEARSQYLEAVKRARKIVEQSPLDPDSHQALGLYCARAGQEECALQEGRRAESMQPDNFHVLFKNAAILAVLGKDDEALDKLERAARLGLPRVEIENDPDLFRLHDNPHFDQILKLAN